MSKKPARKCVTCRHGGREFKIHDVTHLHCEHPDEVVRGEPGWETLREWFWTCEHWAAKDAPKTPEVE